MASSPDPERETAWSGGITRTLAIAATAVVGLPFLFFVWVAVSSRFAGDAGDLHGYGLIFGTFLAIVAGIVVALVAPLIWPRAMRARAYLFSMIAYLLVAAALVGALLTA
nr:hypothetical protein [uncultured Microbacterium sp.]